MKKANIFKSADYETAATAAIQTMRNVEAKGGDFRDHPAYIKAFEALSLMNTVRDMQLNCGRIYASGHGWMWDFAVMGESEKIESVNPAVVLRYNLDGTWTDITWLFA